MNNKMLQMIWVLTLSTVLMTSPHWGNGQARAVEQRSNYCSVVLMQTVPEEANCAGAPNRFLLPRRSVIHLLCCLGALSAVNVTHDYTPVLDNTFYLYILKQVSSPSQEENLAKFVRQCHEKPAVSGRSLTEGDYTNWKVNSNQCQK
ncbi:hypothetical protein V1264_018341 [Littorina saxatilis]|uniref:Uncharacterized protein n=1 Tax=Littorina saxatilis TaxID=31220 RepID=A0AAN9BCG3_9CAEN